MKVAGREGDTKGWRDDAREVGSGAARKGTLGGLGRDSETQRDREGRDRRRKDLNLAAEELGDKRKHERQHPLVPAKFRFKNLFPGRSPIQAVQRALALIPASPFLPFFHRFLSLCSARLES